jgi:hypothetical protein
MAPIIDDAPRLVVRPLDDALMGADHMPFGHVMPMACLQHDDQPFRVDMQAHGLFAKLAGTE